MCHIDEGLFRWTKLIGIWKPPQFYASFAMHMISLVNFEISDILDSIRKFFKLQDKITVLNFNIIYFPTPLITWLLLPFPPILNHVDFKFYPVILSSSYFIINCWFFGQNLKLETVLQSGIELSAKNISYV